MDFAEVLTRAWQITWKYKVLWLFGFIASLVGQIPSLFTQFSSNPLNPFPFDIDPTQDNQGLEDIFPQFESSDGDLGQIFLSLLLGMIGVSLLISLLILVLNTFTRLNVINGTLQIERGQETLTFKQLIKDSWPLYWRILGLNLFIVLAQQILMIVFGVVVVYFTVSTFDIGIMCLIFPALICLIIPYSWLVYLLTEQSNVALVVDNLGVIDALRGGWKIIFANKMVMFLMSLLLLVVGLVITIIISLPMFAFLSPMLSIESSVNRETLASNFTLLRNCLLLYLPLYSLGAGIMQTFLGSIWTLTYLRLNKPDQSVEELEEIPATT